MNISACPWRSGQAGKYFGQLMFKPKYILIGKYYDPQNFGDEIWVHSTCKVLGQVDRQALSPEFPINFHCGRCFFVVFLVFPW